MASTNANAAHTEHKAAAARTPHAPHTAHGTHSASRIKTLRLALRPGASAIIQLAAAITGRNRKRGPAALISVTGFFFPYFPGFPVLAYPGRKPVAPVFPRIYAYRP